MSIDPVKLDNPIDMNALPAIPLTFGLPALPQISLQAVAIIVAYHVTAIGIAVGFASLLVAQSPQLATLLAGYQRPVIILMFVLIVLRDLSKSIEMHYAICVVAVLEIAAVIGLAFSSAASSLNMAFSGLVMALSVWTTLEIGLHYSAIDAGIIKHDPESARKLRERNEIDRVLLAIATGIALCFALTSPSRLFLTLLLTALIAGVALSKARSLSTKPLPFLMYALGYYFTYPSGMVMAPGLIRTNIPVIAIRPLGAALLFTSMVMVPIALSGGHPSPVLVVAWIGVGLLFTTAVLCCGIAFSARPKHLAAGQVSFGPLIKHLRGSKNKLEKDAYFWGVVEADCSPILVDRKLLFEHAHILGSSGRGKSAMRLSPLVEQSISFGDMTPIFIDLKADKLENLANAYAARDELKVRTGIELPVKVFTIQQGALSHVFNPFNNPAWKRFSVADQTSIIAAALNLSYGIDYGRGHYSAVNADVIEECLMANSGIATFHEMYSTLVELAANPSTYIGSLRRSDYISVAQAVSKLASCNVLNMSPDSASPKDVLENQIDLAEAFQTPGIYYFHLPSITSPFVAQSVARLVTKFLLVAAKAAERKTQVLIVIDEFQRMAAENLEEFFTMARSHGVGIVIANQSIADLKASGDKLYYAIEGNCAIRQWLSVTTVDDLNTLEKLFGTHKEINVTNTRSDRGQSVSESLHDSGRTTTTNLHEISDNAFLSVTKLLGDRRGYAQYRGIPFVTRTQFHVTEEEYDKRMKFQWPDTLPGMMEVSELPLPKKPVTSKARPKHDADGNTKKFDPLANGDLFV